MKTILTLTTLAALTFSAHADDDIRLEDCPQPVQTTIKQNARDGKIDEVDSHVIDGKALYIAEVDLPSDMDLKIHVSGDGKLVKTIEDIPLSELPEVVRKAAEGVAAGNGKLDDPDKETADGQVTYHVEIDRALQPDLKLVIAEDGSVLKQTEDMDD